MIVCQEKGGSLKTARQRVERRSGFPGWRAGDAAELAVASGGGGGGGENQESLPGEMGCLHLGLFLVRSGSDADVF